MKTNIVKALILSLLIVPAFGLACNCGGGNHNSSHHGNNGNNSGGHHHAR